MGGIHPVLRYLIACEDILTDRDHPRQVSLVNVISAIRSLETPPYPLLLRQLCVFVQLTECRGPAEVGIQVVHAETGQFAYPGPALASLIAERSSRGHRLALPDSKPPLCRTRPVLGSVLVQ
jgi:hypothetical protein